MRKYFFDCQWYEAYDFIEFVSNTFPSPESNRDFRNACNTVLKEEVSGYRFVGKQIAEIISEEEIAEVEETLNSSDKFKPVANHMKNALSAFTNRRSPDYTTCVKESILAVEALCRMVAGDSKATLGKALKKIEKKVEIHSTLKEAFEKIYGYSSDAEGIRHALLKESKLDLEDAKFMLVSCSAFINYLKAKATKAKIF